MASLTRRLGVYELVGPLATGGMAELFIAKTTGVSGFEKQVALKVIHPNYSSDPDFVRMLIDEAKLAVQLQHANIVQTYDLGQVEGQYYIAMELIDGVDLYKVLKSSSERGLDFPIDVAAHITSEVATGLDYAHRKNDPLGRPLRIVHRDVSPQNVLVSREGEVKIVDFGIAKAALRGQQTQAGVIKGKYFYMSPEQAWGEKIDARTDVFSTGILLHEMLSGEMLYLEEDIDTLLRLVRAADIAPPSHKRAEVPPDLDAIVMKALAKRPEDRYQTGADLSTALTRFLRTRYPEFARSRVARFIREAVETELSRADFTPPPPASEGFSDENSLIFDFKNLRLLGASEAHEQGARHAEEATLGVDAAPRRPTAPPSRSPVSDYDDGGATEFDARPSVPLRERGTDPDPILSRLPAGARGAPPSPRPDFAAPENDDDSTHERMRPAAPGSKAGRPGPSPGAPSKGAGLGGSSEGPDPANARARRPSLAPAPSPIAQRRATLPPQASPPAVPRSAMGLGVSAPNLRPPSGPGGNARGDLRAPAFDPRAEPDTDLNPAPAVRAPMKSLPPVAKLPPSGAYAQAGGSIPSSGQAPLVDWSAAATVTPAKAMSYPGSADSYEDYSSLNTRFPALRRRKLLLLSGGLLVMTLLGLGVALWWPEGTVRGSIEVVSSPSGATVRIDGTVLSKLTPIRISDVDVRQPHHLAVMLRGYDTWESDAKFESGEHEVRMQAVLISAVGSLDITTTPAGAEAIVNGRIGGTTPTKVGDLPPNEDITLELRLRGYKVVYKTLPWGGKRDLSVSIPLERAR